MEATQLITLALLQGLTEFLPISSSAHLILVPLVTGWPDQGLAFDVAVHAGTLLAVMVFFRSEIIRMALAWMQSLRTRRLTPDATLAWAIGFGTIPVGLAGWLFEDAIEQHLRSPLVIAGATLGFGVLLWLADRRHHSQRTEYELTWRDILTIGLAQALALIPGTSRSGITITAGLAVGLSRKAAARFSFLLSIPVIVLAGGLETLELAGQAPDTVHWGALALAAATAATSAYICIRLFLQLLERISMLPFVIYRLLLGIGLFVLFA